jgi:hypothetical protein
LVICRSAHEGLHLRPEADRLHRQLLRSGKGSSDPIAVVWFLGSWFVFRLSVPAPRGLIWLWLWC